MTIDFLIDGFSFKRIKRFYEFNPEEQKEFHVSTILISIIFFFFLWSFTNFNLFSGILTLFYCIFITASSLFLFISIPKLIAIIRGCEVKYNSWTIGLLSAFVISFLFYGFISLIFPGNLEIIGISRLKHGGVFHHETKKDIFNVLLWAPLTNIIIALIFTIIYVNFNLIWFKYIILLNSLMAVISLLPLPNNVGGSLFYVRKKSYLPIFLFSILFFITTLISPKWAIFVGILGIFLSSLIASKLKLVSEIMK